MIRTAIDLYVKVDFIPVLKMCVLPILGRFIWTTSFAHTSQIPPWDAVPNMTLWHLRVPIHPRTSQIQHKIFSMVQNWIIIPFFRGKTRGYATWKSHSILGIWWIIQFQVILVILNWNQWFNPFNIFSIKKSFFNIIVLDVLLFVLKTNKYMILYDFSTKKNCWLYWGQNEFDDKKMENYCCNYLNYLPHTKNEKK